MSVQHASQTPDPSLAADQEESAQPRVLVGRQAILDRDLEVFAYELLFRDDQAKNFCFERDGDLATSRTILNAFFEIGLERLTGGRPAFLNLTRSFFTDKPPIPFEPDSVVLEILEDIPVDDTLIASVKALHDQGYQLALDDFVFEDKWQPLLPYVDLIKVEITEDTLRNMAERIEPLRKLPVKLLAEKVETKEQFRQLHDLGFDLFQGYFFARPDIVAQKQLSESQLVVTRILAELSSPKTELKDIANLIGQDPALSFKMLRLVNSAAIGLRREIDSIQQAVVLLGLQRVRAWAMLFVMAKSGNSSRELLNLGLLRANLCERLSRMYGKGNPDTAYTVGLLSILDGILSMSMQQALEELPLPEPVRIAIGERAGEYGEILLRATELENGSCSIMDETEKAHLMDLFLDSSEAAFAILNEVD